MNLYHYCSNDVMISIISKREIWASDFSLSNDTLEGKWIREVFCEYCAERGVSSWQKEALLPHLDSVIALVGATGFCLSEEADLLSQWRGYADNGCGVSIGFSKEYFEALGRLKRDRSDDFNASIVKVEYDVLRQKELIAEHTDAIIELVSKGVLLQPTLLAFDEEKEKQRQANLRSMRGRFLMFFVYLHQFKNPAFMEEREWRLISHVLPSSGEDRGRQISRMEFRALRDRIVPFRRISLENIDQSAITEIVLGPKNITPVQVVDAALQRHGWSDVKIRKSKASYRG
jgi:hypothetical protein